MAITPNHRIVSYILASLGNPTTGNKKQNHADKWYKLPAMKNINEGMTISQKIWASLDTTLFGYSVKKEIAVLTSVLIWWASWYIIISQPTEAVMVLGMDIGYATALLGIGAYENNVSKKMDQTNLTTTTVTSDNVVKQEISVPPVNSGQ